MKKKLESELISIAHRILKLKGKEDVNRMYDEVSKLYEKLTVLKFAQDNFEDDMPTIGSDSSFFDMLDEAFNNKVTDTIEVEDKIYINLDESEEEEIMEPVMEKIKDIVAQMPQETQQVDDIIENVTTNQEDDKTDFHNLSNDFQDIPVFEPVTKTNEDSQKSLNERLKSGGINIGLNDKLAFIKHLFNGESKDYERVLSQLSTSSSYKDALNFIENIIKPDYDEWKGKEEYEERFLEIIEDKFQ